jgi:drug/metabolite transporter (DMT)-like permease
MLTVTNDKKSKTGVYLLLLFVCIGWGSTWVVSKIGVSHMPPLQLVALRQFLGGLIFCLFYLLQKHPLPTKKQWPIILFLALLNFIFSNSLSTWGVKFISPGLGAIIGAIFPLWLVIIYFFRGRTVKTASIIGLLVGFSGVCIIFYDHLHDFLNPGFRFGIIISILATITWAIGTIYTQEHIFGFNPYFGLGIQMFISGNILYTMALVTHQTVPLNEIPFISWKAIAYLVIVGSVLIFSSYLYVLKHLPMEIASIYAYMNPLFALIIGHFVFPDTITISLIVGGAITLLGVFLVNRSIRG